MTQIYIKQNIHEHRTQNFRRISPFGITPVEEEHKARTRWYRGRKTDRWTDKQTAGREREREREREMQRVRWGMGYVWGGGGERAGGGGGKGI